MPVYIFIQKNAWWLAITVCVAIVISCANVPVFWDMYGQVKTAHYYLQTNFTDLFPNGNGFTDNGHFPLYNLYLAYCFKFFGFNLWVAHLSVIPFIVGLFYQLCHFCKRFLSEEKTLFVLLLTLLHPALQAQSIYFSSEICFVFLSVWLLNTMLDERASRMVLSSTLLCLLNLRALPLVFFLWIYFVFFKKQKNAWYVAPSILFSIVWLFIHFYVCGWMFQNPENIGHRTLLHFSDVLKNTFWCIIKVTDYGNIVALIFMAWFCFQQKKISEPILFVLMIIGSVFAFCAPLSNPINTRYFLTIYVLAIPAFVGAISSLSKQKFMGVCVLFVVFMLQSNWLKKPDKYGNSWDCNLQSLSYFDVRKQLDAYVLENNIPPKEIDAGFQLYFNDSFYLMNGSNKEYALLSDTEMPQNLYVADSNICNNYNAKRKEYLQKDYTLVRGFTKGFVYINLYKRR